MITTTLPPNRTDVQTLRVLVADDEARIRLALRTCLEDAGYLVAEASDGLEAMTRIIDWAPDIMILDLAMPTLDGVRTLAQLEGVHGALKPSVIVLTAWGSMPAALKTIGLGAAMFIEKPLDPVALREIVARVARDRAAECNSSAGVEIDWSFSEMFDHEHHDND